MTGARCLVVCLVTAAAAAVPAPETRKFVRIVRRHHDAMGDGVWAKQGLDGFCFIKSELRSYSVGVFWGPAAARTAAYQPTPPPADADPAARAKALRLLARRDPMPAIVSFNRQLKRAGIELILLPVPGKVAIYPDKLDRGAAAGKRVDLRGSVRGSLRHGGELLVLRRKRRRPRKTRFVVLCDVSSSMDCYSRFLLQFMYGFQRHVPRVETFVFSTRLTRITSLLRMRKMDAAYELISDKVSHWSGGTRIGNSLEEYKLAEIELPPINMV